MLREQVQHLVSTVIPSLQVECSVSVLDDTALRGLCENLLRHRLTSAGLVHPSASDHAYREGLIELAVDHLAGRLRYRLESLVFAGFPSTDTCIVDVSPLRHALQSAVEDWIVQDAAQLDAGSDLVLGRAPWRGWPQ